MECMDDLNLVFLFAASIYFVPRVLSPTISLAILPSMRRACDPLAFYVDYTTRPLRSGVVSEIFFVHRRPSRLRCICFSNKFSQQIILRAKTTLSFLENKQLRSHTRDSVGHPPRRYNHSTPFITW